MLLDISDEADLAELKQALAILDGPCGHCMCFGEPTLELRSNQQERLAVLSIHHGHSLRCAAWKDDAELIDERRLLTGWPTMACLAARGILGE
ncbi:MAG: hypothetical protein R3C10_18735 [Pirellulales bacterium]